jgi:outer membrane protein TolC
MNRACTKRSDYLAGKRELEAQAKRLDIAKAGHWPIISIEGAYGLRNSARPTSHPAGTDDTEGVGFVGVSTRARSSLRTKIFRGRPVRLWKMPPF